MNEEMDDLSLLDEDAEMEEFISDIQPGEDNFVDEEPIDNTSSGDGSKVDDTSGYQADDDDDYTEGPIELFLKEKGINPNSIKIQNDKGETEEVHFNDLSAEEQLDILKYNTNTSEEIPLVNKEEKAFLDELYKNEISLSDYIQYQQQLAIKSYLEQIENQEEEFEIDSLNDDELFVNDLMSKYRIDQDRALTLLEKEKQDEEVFKLKVDALREYYKGEEEKIKEQELLEQEQAMTREAAMFEEAIVGAVTGIKSLSFGESTITLSNDDLNDIASFILDEDHMGVRHIAKALQDPQKLAKISWYLLKGEDAFNEVDRYYKQQISEVSKNSYNKGLADAKGDGTPKNKSNKKITIVNPDKKTKGGRRIDSIDDLDND